VADLLKTLSQTPLPTIFVLAGVLFWILAIAGSVAGKITVESGKQLTAALVGTVFIALGLVLFLAPDITSYFAIANVTPTADTPKGPSSSAPTTASSTSSPTATATATATSPSTSSSSPNTPLAPSLAENKTDSPACAQLDQTLTRPSPGVNCTGTADEVEICGSRALIKLDWELYCLYGAAKSRLNKIQQTELTASEDAWLKQREGCKRDESCLVDAYKMRIVYLRSVQ
jgi:uncharacterized protein YecT (DUF1311 family)